LRHRSRTLLTVQTVRTAITSITIAYLDRFEAKMAELSQMLAALKRSLAAEPSLHRKKPKRCPSVCIVVPRNGAERRYTDDAEMPSSCAMVRTDWPSAAIAAMRSGSTRTAVMRARCNPVRVRSDNEFSLKLGHCGEDVHQPDATKCGIERPHRSIFHTAMASPCAVSPRPSAEQEPGGCRAAVSCHPRRGEKIGSRSQKTMDQTSRRRRRIVITSLLCKEQGIQAPLACITSQT